MKATTIVHWPGRDVLACSDHAARLTYLAWVLNFQLSITPCDPAVECINCANEAAKQPTFAQLCSGAGGFGYDLS